MNAEQAAKLNDGELLGEIAVRQAKRDALIKEIRVLTEERNTREAKLSLSKKFANLGDREKQLLGVKGIASGEAVGQAGAH